MADPTVITASEGPGGPPQGASQLSKMRWAVANPPADPSISFAGKTVLVTGANTGLGLEAALKFALLGVSKLILATRSSAKGEAARDLIVERTGISRGSVVILTVELTDTASVRAFSVSLAKEAPTLDVAILNAGLANPSFERAPGGREMAVQVNVLSTALMAVLILPLLRAAASSSSSPAHLTLVESNAHDQVQREWLASSSSGSLLEVASDEATWDGRRSYSEVKLLGMAVMRGLARATATTAAPGSPPRVIVNAVCPGLCKTDLGRKFGLVVKIMNAVFQFFCARTAEQGARSLVSATALGPESHGLFWHHDILYP